jgi:hypothetical protein
MRRFPTLPHREFKALDKLNTPRKIQDFLDTLPINFETKGATCRSPLLTLRHREAHCMEGALLAAAALWRHGERPLLLDLRTVMRDFDHVAALFRVGGRWGAITKTNHAVLRYRDPVFRDVRELAMSYFNEYFMDDGVKTLRSYSAPFSLLPYDDAWLTAEKSVRHIADDLDVSPHRDILTRAAARRLRAADPIEIEVGKVTEWRKKR